MINFLASQGFLEARNSKGLSPLGEAVRANNYDIVKQLLLCGADVHSPAWSRMALTRRQHLHFTGGETALYVAAECGFYDIASLLLNNGAEQTPNDFGNTPLHVAASLKMVELLVARGGDLTAQNSEGERPMHCATHAGFLPYMKYLVANDVDVSATSCYGTPIEMAIVKGRLDAMEILLEAGATLNFDDDVPRLLEWLQEKINDPDSPRLKTVGLKTRVEALITQSIAMRDVGNHHHFVEMLRKGNPFYLKQVRLRGEEKENFESWMVAARKDMHSVYILFQYPNTLTPLLYPSPISECLKSMLLLPEQTRTML